MRICSHEGRSCQVAMVEHATVLSSREAISRLLTMIQELEGKAPSYYRLMAAPQLISRIYHNHTSPG